MVRQTAVSKFTDSTASERGQSADASSNTTVAPSTNYSFKATSGVANEITLDICGTEATMPLATGSTLKLRVDTHNNDGTFLNTYVTPALYMNDISAVAGNLSASVGNIGKKLTAAPFLPMYFRTICGDGLNGTNNKHVSIRVTIKDADKIKNGMKLNIMGKVAAATANLNISSLDVSMNAQSFSAGQVLVNGGPLGADQGIPDFTSAMTKNATNNVNGDVKIFSSVPIFKNGGDGIDLSSAIFRIKENAANGAEQFATVTIPAAEQAGSAEKNADGLYEYSLGTVNSAAGKSYRVMNTSVLDKFLVYGYGMQNSTNDLININNIASKITETGITVDADAGGANNLDKAGTKSIVNFAVATAAEGASSIKKYEARWATKTQAATMDGSLNFDTLAAAFPNQLNVNTDICATTQGPLPEVFLTGLTPSVINDDGSADDNTRYAVFVRAYTKDDAGNYVAGLDALEPQGANQVGAGSMVGTGSVTLIAANATMKTDASMGFYVSGVPDSPTHVSVRTGKDLPLTGVSFTDMQKDASMSNSLLLTYNDYNVNMRGSHYDSVGYLILRTGDVQYATNVADASFTNISTASWNGNDAAVEATSITIATNGITNVYNTSLNQFQTGRTQDLSNGSSFSIQYAFDNSNGLGYRSAWYPFVPSAHADASGGLFGLDASSDTFNTATGAGWGFGQNGVGVTGTAPAGEAARVDASVVAHGLSAAQQLTRYNIVRDSGSVDFGFSLLNKTAKDNKAAGRAYTSPDRTSGGSDVTGLRYYVYKSVAGATTNASSVVDKTAERIYGQTQRDVSQTAHVTATPGVLGAAYVQTVDATKDTNRLSVSQGYDASGNLVNLKLGQRYDICFGLANVNGFNDASLALLSGFAPMGPIKAVKNLRVGAFPPIMATTKVGGTAANNQAHFDISWEDLSGAAEHGGHLINRYIYGATQYQGSVSGDVTIVANANINAGAAASYQKANAATSRGQDVTANVAGALPLAGYPIKVSVTAVSVASSTGADNDLKYDNFFYNIGGATQTGETATITIPGPKLSTATTDDEVKGLLVTPDDGKLKVSFYKPQNDALKNLYAGAPSVNAYYIYQYDMSLQNIGTIANERAMSRTVTIVNDATDIAAEFFEKELSGVNGKGYVVAVHTQWRYGANNDQLQTSQGVYHTNTGASAIATIDPSLVNGLWILPPGARAAANFRQLDMAVPRGVPSITATNTSLRFDDNGSAINSAAMIQVAPQANAAANTTAFYLDLCSATNMVATTTATAVPVGGHATYRKTYDICATTVLGTNWASEKNFVVIQNNAGSAYVKRNIA
jgi:hypothetical protein